MWVRILAGLVTNRRKLAEEQGQLDDSRQEIFRQCGPEWDKDVIPSKHSQTGSIYERKMHLKFRCYKKPLFGILLFIYDYLSIRFTCEAFKKEIGLGFFGFETLAYDVAKYKIFHSSGQCYLGSTGLWEKRLCGCKK